LIQAASAGVLPSRPVVRCSQETMHLLEMIDAIERMGYGVVTRYGDARETRRALRCHTSPEAP
jgi:hypothetical protein